MKKKSIILAAVIVPIILFVSFLTTPKSTDVPTVISPSEFNEPISEIITKQAVEHTPDGVRFTVKNTSSDPHVYGSFYKLEVLLDGGWYELSPTDGVFPDVACILEGNTTQQDLALIYSHHKDLRPGTYRVIVDYLNRVNGNKEYVVVEFELEDLNVNKTEI